MNKSFWLKLIAIFVLITAICVGGFYCVYKKVLGPLKSMSSTNVTKNDQIQELKLDMHEIFRMTIPYKTMLNLPLSPVIISNVSGKYFAMIDNPIGINTNIRQEAAQIKPEVLKSEMKTPHPVTIFVGDNKQVIMPEMPRSINGVLYYSLSTGTTPMANVLAWNTIKTTDLKKWQKPLTDAGYKLESNNSTNINNNGAKTTLYTYKLGNGLRAAEIMTYTSKKNAPEQTVNIVMYLTSPADSQVRTFLNKVNDDLVSTIIKGGVLTTGQLKWRTVVPLQPYRIHDETRRFGLTMDILTDRTFLDTDAEIVSSSQEEWNSIPLGRAWYMTQNSWNKVKDKFLNDILGRNDVTKAQLKTGIRSKDDIYIKIDELKAVNDQQEPIIKVNVIDKKTDEKISLAFENFSAINVDAIRSNIK